jgi:hypothetical protein
MLSAAHPPLSRLLRSGTRPHADNFRVWSPRRAALRIEYSLNLLAKLARRHGELDGQEDTHGVLYGTRSAGIARVLSKCPTGDLEPIGVFAARARGEVFLTEEDLERLETLENQTLQNPTAIALVIAGNTGGFFVREPDGSMQTIQSFQEFPIRPSTPKTAGPMKVWVSLAITAAALVIAALAWPSHAFAIHEHDGQLEIVLRGAVSRGERLEITDGAMHHFIPITPSLTSVVYTPRTRDVHISVVR